MSTTFEQGELLKSAKLNNAFAEKAPSEHTHTTADIEGFDEAMGGKADSEHGHAISDVTGLGDALGGKANTDHEHAIADVDGLGNALASKAPSAHTHGAGSIEGLGDLLAGKADKAHSHTIDDLPIASKELAEVAEDNETLMTPLRTAELIAANQSSEATLPTCIGQPWGGGFYVGQVTLTHGTYLVILAPKEGGEVDNIQWRSLEPFITPVNSYSFLDSVANTNITYSPFNTIFNWAKGLNIGGYSDWVIPSIEVLRIILHNLYGSGISVSLGVYPQEEGFPSFGPGSEYFPPNAPGNHFSFATPYWSSTRYPSGFGGNFAVYYANFTHSSGLYFTSVGAESMTQGLSARAVRLVKIA